MSAASPSPTPILPRASAVKCLPTEPESCSPWRFTHASPGAPCVFAVSVSWSTSLRDRVPPPRTAMPRTRDPFVAPWKNGTPSGWTCDVQSAGGQGIVARAFGRGLGEIWRLDLEKVEVGEHAARALQQPVAQDQIGLQLRPPQIQMTVLETQLFGGELFALAARDLNRGGLGGTDEAQRRRVDLDVAGRQLDVPSLRRAQHDLPLDRDHGFALERVRLRDELGRRPRRSDADLDDAVPIPQVDEDDSAQVAAPVDPAPQSHPLTGGCLAQLAAAMGPERCPRHAGVYAPPLSASTRMR